MADHIPADIRAEIDQTPEWWDREWGELNRRCFPPKPFDPAEHEGHDLIEIVAYGRRVVRVICTECGVSDG